MLTARVATIRGNDVTVVFFLYLLMQIITPDPHFRTTKLSIFLLIDIILCNTDKIHYLCNTLIQTTDISPCRLILQE